MFLNACHLKEESRVGPHVCVLRSAACTLGYVAHPRFAARAIAALRQRRLAGCLRSAAADAWRAPCGLAGRPRHAGKRFIQQQVLQHAVHVRPGHGLPPRPPATAHVVQMIDSPVTPAG